MNMSKFANKNNFQKVEFDYFYIILKYWKAIALSCLVFLLIGLTYLFITPKIHTSKSTFSINLKNEISTAFGSYYLKTENPLHYLSVLEQEEFKDSILVNTGYQHLKGVRFEIKEEEIKVDSKNPVPLLPQKFDLLVSGYKSEALPKINETALSVFIDNMDKNLHSNMFNQFSSDLNLQIDNLKFSIEIKEKLIAELKENIKGGSQVITSDENYRELIDDRLIKKLEGSERALIVSMMLSGDKRYEHYQESMLTIEEVSLKTMLNSLENKELLLAKLVENKNNGTLSKIFNLPFTNSYYMLTSPENEVASNLSGYLKTIIMFLFIGFFLSV